MKHWRRAAAGIAVITLVIPLAGCSHGLAVGAEDVARTLGDDALKAHSVDVSIPDDDVASLAHDVGISPSTWRSVIGTFAYQFYWGEIQNKVQEQLTGFDESTDGPIRAAIVKSACDVAFERNSSDLTDQVNENVRALGDSPLQEEYTAASDAVEAIGVDMISSDQRRRAAVSAGCYVADQAFDAVVKEASGD